VDIGWTNHESPTGTETHSLKEYGPLTGHTLFQTGQTSFIVFVLFLGQTPTANW